MSRATTIACDQCGKTIGPLYGPLVVAIRSATEPQVDADADLCSHQCLQAWVAKWPEGTGPRR